jgi:hypothetical protein
VPEDVLYLSKAKLASQSLHKHETERRTREVQLFCSCSGFNLKSALLITISLKDANLKLRQYGLSTANSDLTTRLLLCICDLAVINDHRVPRGTLTQGPAELLGECSARVGEEELF